MPRDGAIIFSDWPCTRESHKANAHGTHCAAKDKAHDSLNS